MSINPIIIRQNFKIGELDAESDTLLLENCFIDSGYLSKLLNPSDTSSIVIGRTGAGKSAGYYCEGGTINVRTAIAHRGVESQKASRT